MPCISLAKYLKENKREGKKKTKNEDDEGKAENHVPISRNFVLVNLRGVETERERERKRKRVG